MHESKRNKAAGYKSNIQQLIGDVKIIKIFSLGFNRIK